jgi:hypothetical protein
MSELVDQIMRRHQQLVAQRQPHDSVWREVFDYLAPERSIGWYGTIETGSTTAASQRARLYDNTAMDDAEVLKAAIASGMHPANSRWFDLDAGQKSETETQWMDGATQFLFENIHASGFDAVAYENLSDLIPAGWFVMYIDQARDNAGNEIGGFNFEAWPLWQCYTAASKSNGRVDILHRKWCPTVEQAVTEYGLDKVSEVTRTKYQEGKFNETIEVIWSIEPNAKGKKGYTKQTKPFSSCHIEVGEKHILREDGYMEFPCAVPRWRLIPSTPYATGIGSNVLPSVKTLNDIIRLELGSLDLAISGMWKATDDGVINPRTIKVGARKVIMVADMNNLQPLSTGADFKVSFSKADQLRQSISKSLLADQLTPIAGAVRSATEIMQRATQIRQQLGPMFARFQGEYLQVMIERCFAIAYRAGALANELGPIPDTLKGRDFIVKYISPLARAQKMEEVNAIDVMLDSLIRQAESTQNPSLLDVIDMDAANYEKGLALGVPAKLLRGPEQITAKRQQDSQAKQEAQQQAQAQQLQQVAGQKAVENSFQ